ncbi:patatin [Gordonia sp. TBRC 11910]|uniref:Patatin n=1 Tax=Gordonia asplenii TaxID=2725283 RepID=A0A848KXQ4_9ACTN|nr:patatin-like phospholipase family protein [Gordonia asplenii]NMO03386.1 patatin [Gordonia asplenii]
MTRIAVAIGCGGTIGAAWIVAVLAELADQTGWDPRQADILQGTSAGAELVTMLSGGYGVDDLVAMQSGAPGDEVLRRHLDDTPPSLPRLPRPARLQPSTLWTRGGGHARLTGIAPRGGGDAGWLSRLAQSVVPEGDSWLAHPGARLVAYRVDDGERVAFGAPGSPSATAEEALRASWAIPAWLPPVEIGGRAYVDGGAASTASVDLIAPHEADLIYVIAPMASLDGVRAPGVGGRIEQVALRNPMSAVLRAEVNTVRALGTEVVVLTPSADDMAGLGANFMNRDRRQAAFDAVRRTVGATVSETLAANGVSR